MVEQQNNKNIIACIYIEIKHDQWKIQLYCYHMYKPNKVLTVYELSYKTNFLTCYNVMISWKVEIAHKSQV